jgi:hypothetical protein|tara:strand:+ start:522 stop:803 length:282 start_codon:yes stop_codon:yes gene_type:complete
MKKTKIESNFLSLSVSDSEEFEIEWIPEGEESTGDKEIMVDLPASTVDRICKQNYGHTNWARISAISAEELHKNPAVIDYDEGIIYFKNSTTV